MERTAYIISSSEVFGAHHLFGTELVRDFCPYAGMLGL